MLANYPQRAPNNRVTRKIRPTATYHLPRKLQCDDSQKRSGLENTLLWLPAASITSTASFGEENILAHGRTAVP